MLVFVQDAAEAVASVDVEMGERLGVSKSGYYDWLSRPDSATAQRRDELKLLIQKAFEMSDSTYGYRRVHAQLARWGVTAGLELVRQLMRALGLVPCQPKPKRWSLTRAAAGTLVNGLGSSPRRVRRRCQARPHTQRLLRTRILGGVINE